MTRVLVTGVSGEVGTRLAAKLPTVENVGSVVGVDRRPLSVASPNLRFVNADLTAADLDELMQGVNTVVHLASETGVATLQRMLNACDKAGVSQFVFVSSAAVYGAWPDNEFPLKEDSPLRPNPGFTVAVDFAEQERCIGDFASAHPSLKVAVLRMAPLTGTAETNQTMWRALTSTDWHVSRPMQFLHVDDALSAIALSVERNLAGTYNVAADFISGEKAQSLSGANHRSSMPARLVRPADAALWKAKRYSQSFRVARRYLEHPWVVSSEKLQAEGWKASFSSSEALVAARRPTGWERLRPGQRRAVISVTVAAAPVGAAVGAGAFAGLRLLRKKSRRR